MLGMDICATHCGPLQCDLCLRNGLLQGLYCHVKHNKWHQASITKRPK